MKINSIQLYNLNNNNNTKKYSSQPNNINNSQYKYSSALPTTAQYLAFMGGYSLNLKQTIKQLDILAEKTEKIYPKNIREWLGCVMEANENTKDTLITVHKKYFESLKDCYTLSEIKAKFPEFEGVTSAFEYSPKEGSFIDRFQKGELEYFNDDEDLSVQLIKLYWGEGFSLNDLRQYTQGLDLYHTMKSLNIPRASRDYGHVLKISDPEYNERLTKEMSLKRMEAMDLRVQKRDGEPVYIKRGHKTPEERRRISARLLEFYENHPEKTYEMSERQIRFYEEHPEKKEELTRVLNIAWNVFGAERIKMAMSKFFSANGIKNVDPVNNPEEISKKHKVLMQRFWGNNEWAKKSFSKSMKYAYKKVKQQNETFYELATVPKKLGSFVEEKLGVEKGSLNFNTKYNPYLETSSIDGNLNSLFNQATQNVPYLADVMADTFQLTPLLVIDKIKKMHIKSKDKVTPEFKKLLIDLVLKNRTKNGSYAVQTTEEARGDYLTLVCFAAKHERKDLLDLMREGLDTAFELSSYAHEKKDGFILK